MEKLVCLKAPENVTSAGLCGQKFSVVKGKILIPADLDYRSLFDHGFRPCSDEDMSPIFERQEEERLKKLEEDKEAHEQSIENGNAFFGRTIPEVVPLEEEATEEETAEEEVTEEESSQEEETPSETAARKARKRSR